MATKPDVKQLEKVVLSYSERIALLEKANPSGSRSRWPDRFVPLITLALSIFGIGIPIWIHFDGKIDKTNQRVDVLSQRVDKLDSAVRVLNSQQSDQTQRLVEQLIATARSSSNSFVISKATDATVALVANLRREQRPATPEFFGRTNEGVSKLLQNADSAAGAFEVQLQLAEYRSALNPRPDHFDRVCPPGKSFDFIAPHDPGRKRADMIVIGGIWTGCSQTLDGFVWRGVTFVGVRITYRGGPVILDHVQFVNGTFVVPNIEPRTIRFLDYAALDMSSLDLSHVS